MLDKYLVLIACHALLCCHEQALQLEKATKNEIDDLAYFTTYSALRNLMAVAYASRAGKVSADAKHVFVIVSVYELLECVDAVMTSLLSRLLDLLPLIQRQEDQELANLEAKQHHVKQEGTFESSVELGNRPNESEGSGCYMINSSNATLPTYVLDLLYSAKLVYIHRDIASSILTSTPADTTSEQIPWSALIQSVSWIQKTFGKFRSVFLSRLSSDSEMDAVPGFAHDSNLERFTQCIGTNQYHRTL